MNELARVLEAYRQERQARRSAVLATVVRVCGSTYRKQGARMLFRTDVPPVGMISGGCLEEDLAERARVVLDSGEARTVVYDMRSPDDIVWGLGLGCDGEVRVLLECLPVDAAPDHLEFRDACNRGRKPGVVATIFEVGESAGTARVGDRLTLGEDGSVSAPGDLRGPVRESFERDLRAAMEGRRTFNATCREGDGRVEALIEYVAPTVRLVVFGAGMDALPVVELAERLGWQVIVADHRAAYASPRRFPRADAVRLVTYRSLDRDAPPIDDRTPALVMTHHFLHDLELLAFLLPTSAPYVGVLGPRKRTEKALHQLAERGFVPTAAQLARLHGPVGVDLGAQSPEEIALSAIAEIQAVLTGRGGGFLRERSGPLHDPS